MIRLVEWYRDNLCYNYRLKPVGLGRSFIYAYNELKSVLISTFSPNRWMLAYAFHNIKQFNKEKENETMKKRVVAGLLTVAMAVAMMSGCGKSQDTASETAEELHRII